MNATHATYRLNKTIPEFGRVFVKGNVCYIENCRIQNDGKEQINFRMNIEGGSRVWIAETFNQDFEPCEGTIFNIYWEDYTIDGDYSDSNWRFFVSVVADTERKAQNIFKKWYPSKNARFTTFGGWRCCKKNNATSNKFTANI